MIKRRSPRQQKPRIAKVQNETQSPTTGVKRGRKSEDKSSKRHKASDNVDDDGRRKSTSEEKSSLKQKDSDDTHDNYCWKCHKYCQDEKCSTCNRVYCFKCFKGHVNQVCESCLQQNASEDAFSTIVDTSSLLLSVIETSFPPEEEIKNKRLFSWQPRATEVKLCHIVDYTYIDSKSKDTDGLQYRSPAELLDDVKWMHHNCVIIYGEHHDVTKEAKKILKQFTQEIDDLSDCAECYRKRFLNICDTPHPLIMAKQKSFPPWPAKCLRIVDSKAHVRYFGSHEMAKVPLKDCYFISDGNIGQKKSKTFEKAKDEFSDYIQLFEETFGEEYPYQPKDTPFDEEVGKELMRTVKEKYQRAQKASRRSNPSCRVIDLTGEENCRDNKNAVEVISEENGQTQFQHSDDSDPSSFLNSGNSSSSCSHNFLNNFIPSGSQNNCFSSVPSIPFNSQARNTAWLLPPYGSPNESGISISNVYSGSDPHPLPELDLNARNTPFLINDSSHSIQTASNIGIHPPFSNAEAESNNREEIDDDIQVVEELNSNTQHRGGNFKNIDENLVQVILCRDPAYYSILQAANALVRQLFIQFWGIANGIKNAPAILSAQEEKIKKLKKDKAELRSECDDRVANADSILRSIYAMKCDSLTQNNNALQQKNKELEELVSNLSKDLKYYKNSLDRSQEAANDYKKNNYTQPPMATASVLEFSKTVEKITVMTKK